VKFRTAGLSYATLLKEYLEAMRLWGAVRPLPAFRSFETKSRPAFRSGTYAKAGEKTAERAIVCVHVGASFPTDQTVLTGRPLRRSRYFSRRTVSGHQHPYVHFRERCREFRFAESCQRAKAH
jgi:hypothetical protein